MVATMKSVRVPIGLAMLGSLLSECLHFDHEDLFPYWIGVLLLYFEEILIV
jgi:hypothetical protein